MMGSFFLLIWSLFFLAVGRLIWQRLKTHFKLYVLLFLNLIFLAGVFLIYPLLIGMGG